MSGPVLGQAIMAAVDAAAGAGPGARAAMFEGIGNAIVAHIESLGVVAVTVSTPVPAGAGGLFTGTGSGTIS